MRVFGADFSGAQDPSKGIYYAEGHIKKSEIIITALQHCDDRLDLFDAVDKTSAPWGLDFPFSIPDPAYSLLGVENWTGLLKKVAGMNRDQFNLLLQNCELRCESICKEYNPCCRLTDIAASAFSPFKKYNPHMRGMTYTGLKFLYYLRKRENSVYPFDELNKSKSRIYEIYPSDTWRMTGVRDKKNITEFVRKFKEKTGVNVVISNGLEEVQAPDAADAVAASVTMGYLLIYTELDRDWNIKPYWACEEEWKERFKEGVVVRIK